MTIFDDSIYIAGLQSVYSIGAAYVRRFIDDFGSPHDAWEAIKNAENLRIYSHIPWRSRLAIAAMAKDERLTNIMLKMETYHMDCCTYLDDDFPPVLQQIYNPPAILFMRGNRALLDERLTRIAIVGARKCSLYGRNVARMLGKELGAHTAIIVSGGARGIDCHGHEGTLASHGYAITVMGCGLDIAYPRENAKLFDRILVENGLLLSEYPPGTPPSAKHFPARNRIISGLCKAVVIVEAKASSGSLITADMANNEGRDVFVVPCNLLDHAADGNKFLIRNGAHVLTGAEDIVQAYGLQLRQSCIHNYSDCADPTITSTISTRTTVNDAESIDTRGGSMLSCNLDRSTLLNEIPHDRCITVSELLRTTHIPLERLQPLLLELEIDGAIENHPPRGYINMTRSDILVH